MLKVNIYSFTHIKYKKWFSSCAAFELGYTQHSTIIHCLHSVNSRGLLPAECDKNFLELACRLDRYGMDFHPVMVSSTAEKLLANSLLTPPSLCLIRTFPTSNCKWVCQAEA